MRRDADPTRDFDPDVGSFPFLEVEGAGVYEIPVGPVHAGLIEPGHFRFSVVGETILRMKARLWFVHRGIEKLFEGRPPAAAIEIAERISGDTAVGHALAFAMAVEDAAGIAVTEKDRCVRALLLELERLYNHVADLGALCNDVGFGIANAHAQRMREPLLRLNADHRPPTAAGRHRPRRRGPRRDSPTWTPSAPSPRSTNSPPWCWPTPPSGTASPAPRSSRAERPKDSERSATWPARPASTSTPAATTPTSTWVDGFHCRPRANGDVLSRFQVRVREAAVSAALIVDLAARLRSGQPGPPSRSSTAPDPGLVRPRRRLARHHRPPGRARRAGTLSRSRSSTHPSSTGPPCPLALADTIVPDFPLANKSFNLSYAGNDL